MANPWDKDKVVQEGSKPWEKDAVAGSTSNEPGFLSSLATRVKQGVLDPLYSELQQSTQALASTNEDNTIKGNLLRAASWLDPTGMKQSVASIARLANMIPAIRERTQALQAGAQQTINQREQEYKQALGGQDSFGGAIIRGAVNPMNYIGGATAPLRGGARKVIGALAQRAAIASAGAGAEPSIAASPEQAMQEQAQKRAMGALAGATIAPVAEKVLEKAVVPALAKTVNAFRSKLDEGAIAPAAERFIKDADLLGVTEYSAGQAMRGGAAKQIEGYTTGIPLLGPRGKLKAGLEQLTKTANAIDNRLQGEMKALGYANQDELVQAAANGNRNATRLVGRIAESADDANRIVQTSLDAAGAAKKAEVGKLYTQVGTKMRGTGDVSLDETMPLLRQLHDTEASSVAPNENILRESERLIARLQDPNVSKDWNALRKAVSDLGNKAKMATKGSDPDMAASSMLGDIREAIRKDMNAHVLKTGNDDAISMLQTANKAYQSEVRPYNDRSIRSVVDSTEPDRAVKQLINTPGFSNRAQNVYNMLDDKGKAAFRYSLFHDALEKAGGAGEAFSPAKLASELEKRMGEIGVTFKGRDLAEMQAVTNVMRHMEGTRLADFVPNNGAKLLPWAAGAGLGANPGAIAPTIGFGLLAKFFTTGPGKKWTLAASKLPPGSPMLDKIVKEAVSKMPRGVAQAAAETSTEE